MKKGLLIVLSGPSGVGKGTIYHRLLEIIPGLTVSVSVTTRAPRVGEINGVHYYFVTEAEFERMRDAGELLEWAETVHNHYGTPKKYVYEKLSAGNDVLLEIDVKGAKQIKAASPDCVTIFVLPPNEEELRRRLTGRGTETPEQISARLELAKEEIAQRDRFDYDVVNDDLERAVGEIVGIIEREKAKRR